MARPVFYTPIKRSHMVAPFGVGALLLSRNGVGVVVCGQDEWLHERPSDGRNGASWLEKYQVVDAHLQQRLGVNRLVQAPAVADEPNEGNTWFVRVARFPLSEYCINPKCRRLVTRQPEGVSQGQCSECEKPDGKKRAWPTQQTPLVLACRGGHLSDIPWTEWTHDAQLQATDENGDPRHPGGMCTSPRLTYQVATDITAPRVECATCHAGADLGGLRNFRHGCPGVRPWLPGTPNQPCGEVADVIERTATAAYYPDVRSALHLPHGPHVDHRLMALLAEPVAAVLLRSYSADERPDDRDLERLVAIAAARGITTDTESVADHVRAAIAPPADVDDSVVRAQELAALLDSTPRTSSTIGAPPLVIDPRPIADYSGRYFGADPSFSAVSAVPRLAETRALVGFSRVKPRRIEPAEGFEQQWGFKLDAARERDWLVAHRVYGEGILLLLNTEKVQAWEEATLASEAAYREGKEVVGTFRSTAYLLAHTLSHVLLREAATVCGYSLPSLRERIYATVDAAGQSQTGLLIYTAEGDAYGTLRWPRRARGARQPRRAARSGHRQCSVVRSRPRMHEPTGGCRPADHTRLLSPLPPATRDEL